jgi:hypothetical protein
LADSQGFWSYVHADDIAEGGRIARLATDVAAQFEMLTGEPLTLFLDKDAIKWGDDWRDKIDSTLATVAFFIPVLTPRYFMSPECRRELHFFAHQATRLGMKELVLPLLYVDVPALHAEATADELITMVRTFQWEDWRELRFLEPAAAGYRKGVASLAARLVEANRQAEKTDAAAIGPEIVKGLEGSEDSPGFIDQMAASEEAMPKVSVAIEAIGTDIELIGTIMHEATAEIQQANKGGKGFASRLLIARKVARRLAEPAERILTASNEFASQFNDVDVGIRAMIEAAGAELKEKPEQKKVICDFFGVVRSFSAAASGAFSITQQMIDTIGPLEKLSKDLRPPLRRLREGLTRIVEANEIGGDWIRLIEASGIDCDGAPVLPTK